MLGREPSGEQGPRKLFTSPSATTSWSPSSAAYKDEKDPKDLPVARRRDSWSFLLADAEDMERLNRVTLDGETALVQVADALAPQIAQFHRLLESTGAERAEDLGIPASVLQEIVPPSECEGERTPRF